MLFRRSVAAAFTLVLVTISCTRRQETRGLSNHAANAYVDAHLCASCHPRIYEHFGHTGMARSFYVPTPQSVSNVKPYYHRPSNTWFQIVSKDGAYYQRSWQVGFSGKEESIRESRIDYVMGSGNHVRTYLHRTGRDTLIELQLAWYAEKGGYWAMNPGYDSAHPPTARKIGYDCMFCHNAYPSIPAGHDDAGAEPVFSQPLPQGIDCQRCHGPGGDHVRAAQASKPNAQDIRKAILNPSRLAPGRAMEVCMQCHLETTSFALPNAIRRFDRGPYSYRPDEPLAAFMMFYDHASGSGKEDKFEIVNSAYRLRKSQCFLRSDGALGCTTCHNPHNVFHGPEAVSRYNEICRGCHAVVKTAAHPKATNCIDCHMPKRRTEDVVHAVMTDHLIQRRPLAANLLADIPERHGKEAEYHGEVVPYGTRDDIYTAVAQLVSKSNLESGIPRLEAELRKSKPAHAEFYIEMGDAYRATGKPGKAVELYRQALERRPGSALIQRRLAEALQGVGQPQPALEALLNATRLDPRDAGSWYDLGVLQASLAQSDASQRAAAIVSLGKATVLDPDLAEAHNSLGAVLAEAGQPDAAETAFRTALKIDPTLDGAHANLANLLVFRERLAEAAWHYERAGRRGIVQFNYGVTLARMNRLAEAQTHIEAALKDDPNLAEAHDVLGGLFESRSRIEAALAEYREAIRIRPNFGKAHLDAGTLLANRRERAAAAEEFRKAQADPDPEIRQQAAAALRAIQH